MATVGEPYFAALLDRDRLERHNLSRKDVAHVHLVLKRNHKVKTTRVESYGKALLGKGMGDLKLASLVVPDVHCLVEGAGHDQLLTDANIQASDQALMEGALDIVELGACALHAVVLDVEAAADHLALRSDHVHLSLLLVEAHRFDRKGARDVSSFVASHRDDRALADRPQGHTVVSTVVHKNAEGILSSDQETMLRGHDSFNCFANGRVEDVCLELAVVFAHDHLTVIRANQDITVLLAPVVTGEVGADLAALLKVVNLGVLDVEVVALVVMPELAVFVGVLGTSDKNHALRRVVLKRIPAHHEVARLHRDRALETDTDLSEKAHFLPVPKEH